MTPEEPTDVMPGGQDEPTRENRPGDEPTGQIPTGDEQTTNVIAEGGASRKGIGLLVGAIIASILLVGAYVAAGGPVSPDKAADPCDPRPWTDPQDLEEAAQQFALSAADGAACELGVSREELTRAIADDQSLTAFKDGNGFSDGDIESALRAGLNRAVDDAENAGAIGGLAAVGIRAAIKVMPMSVMIDLLENADSIFTGDLGSLGGIGDAIDAITGGVEDLGGSGTTEDPLGSIGDAIQGALPEGTTDALDQAIPEDTRKQLEEDAKEKLKQGLNDLLAP